MGVGCESSFESGCVLTEGKGWKRLEPREGAENTAETVRKASLGDSQFACGIPCTQGARQLPWASVPETQTQTTKWYPPQPAALLPAQSQTTNSWLGQNCKTHFCVQAWEASHYLKPDLFKMWMLRNGVFPALAANKDVTVISHCTCHNHRWRAAEPWGSSWRKQEIPFQFSPVTRSCPTLFVPFSSCLQSFPASGSFSKSQLFASVGRSIAVSASASVLPMNSQDWFPLRLTGLISLQSKGFKNLLHSSKASILRHSALFMVQLSHPHMTTGKTYHLAVIRLSPLPKASLEGTQDVKTQETGPRKLRCRPKERLQWDQTLASSYAKKSLKCLNLRYLVFL